MHLYAVVNYKTCGYCRKFKPVLEGVIKSMNVPAQKRVEIVDLETTRGQELKKKLKFSGGIPCLVAIKDDEQILFEPGYKDTKTLAKLLLDLWTDHV